MDADRFDTLSRAQTARVSRRAATTAVLGGMLGLLGLSDTGAKKKKGKGKGCVLVGNGISRSLPGTENCPTDFDCLSGPCRGFMYPESYQSLTPGC